MFQGDSPELDLIALGDTNSNNGAFDEEDIIFDPLLEKESKSTHRPLSRATPIKATPTPALVNSSMTSSEELLREYGLDFSSLSVASSSSSNPFQSRPANPMMNNNFFDDLDPLKNIPKAAPIQRPSMAPPMAPPRTKKVSQNWTTFD